jgi:hypothetical protein
MGLNRNINPIAIGAGKKGLSLAVELIAFAGLAVWIVEVLLYALHSNLRLFPSPLETQLLSSLPAMLIGVILITLGLVIFILAFVSFGDSVARQKGSFIRYIWWYQPDGSGSFTNKNALTGSGEAREEPGAYPALKVGPLLVGWSIGAANQGYVYFRHPDTADFVYGLVLTKKTDIRSVDAKLEFLRVE